MNRSQFQSPFRKEFLPPWPCPECKTSALVLRGDTYTFTEAVSSKRLRGHHDWDPESISEHCSFQMVCVNPACREVVYVVGRQTVELSQDPYQERADYEEVIYPLFFLPAPPIISLPSKCPPEVASQVERAFSLYWSDLDSAGTRLRIAIERLLDSTGVEARSTLHQRIQLYKKKEPELGDCLLAIKWLANEATHETGLLAYDVLDGFDILEHVLEQIYDPRTKKISKKVIDINQRKGGVRKG
jgi:hypothetical protein